MGNLMETLNVIGIILVFLLIGLVLFYGALYLSEKGMKKKVAIRSIFREFKQKMWMTVGLGVVFFSLYLLIVSLGSRFNDPSLRLDLFFLVYEHPVVFIYLGLFTFAVFSTGIYLVRLVIKHFYNTKSKY